MTLYLKIVDKFNKSLLYILGVMLLIMVIVIAFQVLSRFVLKLPLSWTEELARYLMVFGVFWGAAYAWRNQGLIAVEFVAQMLPDLKRNTLKILINAIGALFMIFLMVKGVQMLAIVNTQISSSLQISMAVPYSALPTGALFMFINAVAVIMELIQERRELLQ